MFRAIWALNKHRVGEVGLFNRNQPDSSYSYQANAKLDAAEHSLFTPRTMSSTPAIAPLLAIEMRTS